MIIGIDASSLTLPHPTGVQRYSEYIIRHLLLVGDKCTFRLYTPKALAEPFAKHQVILKAPRAWTQIRLPLELLIHQPDVFFQPAYMLPPFLLCPSVVTVHDLGFLRYPGAYSESQIGLERLAMKRLMQYKSKVIVPSVSAQQDLLEAYDVDPARVHVVPEALIPLASVNLKDFPEILRHKRQKVILAVGRLEERKNLSTLIRAVDELASHHTDQTQSLTLVLVGQPGFGAEHIFVALKQAKHHGVTVVHRANADDSELAAWFSVASVYVYPSLYEGFGLPILQAFAARVPVITTHVSSMPEVAGSAALYVKNPKDEHELAAAINAVAFDQKRRQAMTEKGTAQLKMFSWSSAAQKTLSIFEKRSKT